jgi:ribosomal protein RSM22 (predicted rRNA methylase)
VGSRIKTSKMKGEDESQWNSVNVNLQQDNSTKKSGKWRRPTLEAWCAIVCDPRPKEIQGLQTSQT